MVDSSVLLDLYRVTPNARKEMIDSLTTVKENLWVPHQVALEFHQNRIEAARDQLAFYDETCKSLETAENQALQRLNEFANRSALDSGEKKRLKEPLESAFRAAIERVKSHQGVFDLTLGKVLNDDPVLKALASLLDGRIGDPLSDEDYVNAQSEAQRRRDGRIPPGYKDRAKKTNADGDYLWWEQTLIKASEARKNVLIISNDEKEDWVTKRLDFSLGPREELTVEMQQRAEVSLRIVNFTTFLEAIRVDSAVPVSRETLSQANSARRQGVKRSNQIIVSTDILDEYQEFIRRALARRERELKASITERAKATDDPDAQEVIENRIVDNEHAVAMYTAHLIELREVAAEAPRLKGDVILNLKSKSLRSALLERAHMAKQEQPADTR